ncbi:hypothetical protein GCM10011399_08640 [Subtercola lobariae]|uniref:DUF72 domain-containing protein n=1 Tax=Subtercola lobariae TaxID=1588641 RepID=A0A917B410_9MICO|nr:hypothetical protein GCM10011399_08640 [Subtercola lobariae]
MGGRGSGVGERRGQPDGAPRDVYVYFDNDTKVRSPFDAMGLRQRLAAQQR